MSGQRPALRGQGYMKKGGAAATQVHNASERDRAAVAAASAATSAARPAVVGLAGASAIRQDGPRVVRGRLVVVAAASAVAGAAASSGLWWVLG